MTGIQGLRQGAIAIAIVAILAIGAIAGTVAGWWIPSSGPLADLGVSAIAVDFPLGDRALGTWGNVLPRNPTSEDITIRSVELIGVRGVSVLGMSVNDPSAEGGIGTAYGYPPPGATDQPPEGATLPSTNSEQPHLQLLVGVQRLDRDEGAIEAILLRYDYQGREYQLTLPYSLRVFDPES